MANKRECQHSTAGASKKKTHLKDTTEVHQNRGAFHAHGVLAFDEAVEHVADDKSEAN